MDGEQNQEVPEAVTESQDVATEHEEKAEPKSEVAVEASSEPAPEHETPAVGQCAVENDEVTESAKPEKTPEAEKPPEVDESAPEPEQKKESKAEPQVQVNSEPEKQEEEAVKEVEPKKEEEPKKEPEAKPEEVAKDGETQKEDGEEKAQASEAVQAEAPKEAEAEQKEPGLPLFFGWFLLPEEEERIKCATMDFLKTLDTLEAFKQHISEFTGEAEKEVDLEQYFQTTEPLHCTTMFCDYGKVEGAKEYAELQAVKDSLDKSDEISVTALLVTPRTFGARVELTETQMKLWPEGGDKAGAPTTLLPSIEAVPAGSRAHVTLGCSAGVEPVQTGFDLLEILALQKESKEGTQVEMELGTLSYLGEGRWFLALREAITADATFSSFSENKPTTEQGKKNGDKKKKKCAIL